MVTHRDVEQYELLSKATFSQNVYCGKLFVIHLLMDWLSDYPDDRQGRRGVKVMYSCGKKKRSTLTDATPRHVRQGGHFYTTGYMG